MTISELPLAQTVFNYCTSGDLQALSLLPSEVDDIVHSTFPDGQTCLIAACRNGHRDIAEYLIKKKGADVEQVGVVEFESEQVEGVPPLWCAAAAGHLRVVELLVSRGADVNRTTITNSTALRAACFDGHEQVVRFLVEHGANVEIPNRHGHTCLMISCFRRHDQIVEYLLSKRARVNRRSAKGNTALHDCAESCNLKGLQLLLEHRAIMRKDEYGQSPIMSGANAAFKKIVDYLTGLSDSMSTNSLETPTVSIHEKIAAYELLGAGLFDRHSQVQDAVNAWYHAMRLRQSAGTYPKPFMHTESTTSTSNFSADGPGTSWNLVSLAARESVALSEREDISTEEEAPETEEPEATVCPSEISNSVDEFYRTKHNVWQRELYETYCEEFKRLQPIPSTHRALSFTVAHSLAEIPPPMPTACPVYLANPVDPLRSIEPTCWSRPRYCQWWQTNTEEAAVSSTGVGSSSGRGDVHSRPRNGKRRASRRVCTVCGRWRVGFGTIGRRVGSGRICVACIVKASLLMTPYGQAACLTWSTDSSVPIANETTPDTDCSMTDTSTTRVYAAQVSTRASIPVAGATATAAAAVSHRSLLAADDHPRIHRLRQCGEEAFGRVREFASLEELDELTRNAHALRLQPLLIRSRILGPDHPDTIYFIRYRGAIYADANHFRQCLHLWRYALELQRIFLEPLCHVSQAAFVSFAELFQFILTNNYSGLPADDLEPGLIVDCLELAVDNIERGMDYSFYQWYRRYPWSYTTADKEAVNLMRHVVLCLHFIAMILQHYIPEPNALPRIPPLRRDSVQPSPMTLENCDSISPSNWPEPLSAASVSADETVCRMHGSITATLKQRFLAQIYRLVRLDPRVHQGQSLIHLVCSADTSQVGRYSICTFPNTAVLELLLQLGADPNCADAQGQRPLLSVLTQRRLLASVQATLVGLMVKYGAHLDATNKDGVSALDARFRHILLESGCRIMDHVTLACQAARVVHRTRDLVTSQIAQQTLPSDLMSFIHMH